jgi:hypothetical protein
MRSIQILQLQVASIGSYVTMTPVLWLEAPDTKFNEKFVIYNGKSVYREFLKKYEVDTKMTQHIAKRESLW